MIISGQTLIHKKTKRFVRFNYYCHDGYDCFNDEHGRKFFDHWKNYTHIEDWFGRPVFGKPKKGEFVDKSLKKYLVPEKEREKIRKKELEKWAQRILDRMDGKGLSKFDKKGKLVFCPFADGSHCDMAEKYFLKKMKAKPLYKTAVVLYGNNKESLEKYFYYKGKKWCYMGNHLVVLIDDCCFSSLKEAKK